MTEKGMRCPECGGDGWSGLYAAPTCYLCGGSGHITDPTIQAAWTREEAVIAKLPPGEHLMIRCLQQLAKEAARV